MSFPPKHLFALLDCNSFFASCEKLFRPDLKNKAVVVLSNNDGVVVARSPEAKQLVPMGEPFFKIKHLAQRGQIVVFSSNYRLYGDMSNRVMRTLRKWTPHVEVYSIDEAFLDLSGIVTENSLDSFLHEIRSTVTKNTGIPVSLGVGPTMTLAKVANDLAKKHNGIRVLVDVTEREKALASLEIKDVWGIGRRLAPKMYKMGIRTASDLVRIDPLWMRKNFSVVQEQLVRELRGERCLSMTTVPAPRKSIQVSRSFAEATNSFRAISEAVSTFAAKACEKARSEGTVASAIYVHLNTSWHRADRSYISDGKTHGFNVPTANSPEVIRAALNLLCEIYRDGPLYKKASVTLLDLQDEATVKSQGFLFEMDDQTPEERERNEKMMDSVDEINRTFGRGTLFFGSQGIEQKWRSDSELCSPNYTLRFEELPVVRAR